MLKYVFLCLWWLCDSHWMEVRGRWKLEKANSAYYNPTTPCHPSNTSQPHWDHNKKGASGSLYQGLEFVELAHTFSCFHSDWSACLPPLFCFACVSQIRLTSQVSLRGPRELPLQSTCAHSFVWERRPRQEFQTSLFQHFTPAAISNKWPLPSINPVSLHSRAHQGSNWKIEQGREHQLPKPDCK